MNQKDQTLQILEAIDTRCVIVKNIHTVIVVED